MAAVKCLAAIAGLAALASAPAQAAPRCITPAQVSTLTRLILPAVIDAGLTRCQTLLPGTSYLVREAGMLRQRFSADEAADGPALRGALSAFAGARVPEGVSDEVIGTMMKTEMVKQFGVDRLPPEACRSADLILEPLDALPRENVERLLTAVFTIASKRDRRYVMCEGGQ